MFPTPIPGSKRTASSDIWLHLSQITPTSSALTLGSVCREQLWGEAGRQSCWRHSHHQASLWSCGGTVTGWDKCKRPSSFPMASPTGRSLEESRKKLAYRTIKSMIHLLSQTKTHPWVRIYWSFRALRNWGGQGDHKGSWFIGYLVCSNLTCTSFTSIAHLAAL